MDNILQVSYSGAPYSLNQAYKLHWTKKKKIKEDIIKSLVLSTIPSKKIIKYSVTVTYHSRLDVDNTTALLKVILDYLRGENYLVDDSPKYFKSLNIAYDNSQKKEYLPYYYPPRKIIEVFLVQL